MGKRKNTWLAAFLLLSLLCEAQILNTQYQAKLELESDGEFFDITGIAVNKTQVSASLRYVISAITKEVDSLEPTQKKDLEGTLVIEPGQRVVVAKYPISIPQGERTIFLLLLYDLSGKIVGQDRVVVNDSGDRDVVKKSIADKTNQLLNADPGKEDGVFRLTGIITESTKTKPGRDFYRAYASIYNKDRINGERPVNIEETVAFGSSTRITVSIEGTTIMQFFINPRADYIEQMADIAIARTNRYFDQLEKNQQQVIRY